MGLFDSVSVVFEGKKYSISKIAFSRANKLADLFYQDLGYPSRPEFDYSQSQDQIELAMFKMALRALFARKIKPCVDVD